MTKGFVKLPRWLIVNSITIMPPKLNGQFVWVMTCRFDQEKRPSEALSIAMRLPGKNSPIIIGLVKGRCCRPFGLFLFSFFFALILFVIVFSRLFLMPHLIRTFTLALALMVNMFFHASIFLAWAIFLLKLFMLFLKFFFFTYRHALQVLVHQGIKFLVVLNPLIFTGLEYLCLRLVLWKLWWSNSAHSGRSHH